MFSAAGEEEERTAEAGRRRAVRSAWSRWLDPIPTLELPVVPFHHDGGGVTVSRIELAQGPALGIGWTALGAQQRRRLSRREGYLDPVEWDCQSSHHRFHVCLFAR